MYSFRSHTMRDASTADRIVGGVLTLAIVELTLTTAYIHLTLGGALFTLNAAGYAALALGMALTYLRPELAGLRIDALARLALGGYTLATIGGYLVLGPYFALGWVAKAIELAILTLLGADWILGRWRARPDSNPRLS
jgi:hypothetical protein